MKNLITLLTLCLLSNFCYALTTTPSLVSPKNQAAFNQVQQILSQKDSLSGEFKQTRRIKILSSPLVSRGHFTLSKKEGLRWYQVTPFTSTLIVTANKIEQVIGDNPATIITKKQQPIVFSFTNIFLSIFNGNMTDVRSLFDVYFSGDVKQWRIILKPNSFPLNKAIESIELTGGASVKSITITDAKQNQVLIQLSNVREK